MMHASRSRGFTLIEILIVVAIICVLIALLMPALALLRRMQAKASTMNLFQHLSTGLTNYLHDYPLIGDSNVVEALDFEKKPYEFLCRRPNIRREPYLEIGVARAAKGSAGVYSEAVPTEAEHILDHYRSSDHSNLVRFEVLNDKLGSNSSAKWYTYKVRIISDAGTKNLPKDDVIFEYTADTGQFEQVQ
jgi:prepilin-type N-terminal cleavage/methylation domain-containing protein